MRQFITRRIIQAVIVLILVTLLVFLAMRLLPGDPIYMIMTSGQMTSASVESIEAARHEFGLDRPIMVQYLCWLAGVAHGDLGISIIQHRPILDIVARGLPITLDLALLSFIISLIIGIFAGVICAIRRGKWLDTVVTVLANVGITIPIFWLGIMLIYLFALKLDWLPVQGYTSLFTDPVKNIRQTIMPIFCLSIFPLSATARQARSSMLEVMHQDYIRTAWSKGLKERIIVIRHALKNSLIPVITLSGVGLSMTFGGSVLVEQVYNINGVGRLLLNAVFAHDYPVVQGFVLVLAVMILFINFVVDVSYGWLDPRIRYE
jgi:peptide/nickel transport system permease protein